MMLWGLCSEYLALRVQYYYLSQVGLVGSRSLIIYVLKLISRRLLEILAKICWSRFCLDLFLGLLLLLVMLRSSLGLVGALIILSTLC
jgi:hypothetical protein